MKRAGVAGAALGASAFMAWAVRGRSSSVFGPSVWRGDCGRAAVALTFDDGPSESTPQILEILDRHGVPATFFQCGANVERLPEIARAVRDAGHEIGNHSYSHPFFHFRSAEFMEGELARAQVVISEVTGAAPVLMRAPFGVRWPGIGAAQRRLGLMSVMWTAIGYDWKWNAGRIADRLARTTGNGSILCLHDGRRLEAKPAVQETVEAVRRLIPLLQARGYKLETVTQLICPKN